MSEVEEQTIHKLNADTTSAKERCKTDFNFFAGLCLTNQFLFPFPRYYVALFFFIVNAVSSDQLRRILRLALGLPRGFAKTTFLKVVVVWLIVHDKFSFFVICCAAEDKAQNFISDVYNILCSPNIVALYGDFQKKKIEDNKTTKQAFYRGRMVILYAIGVGSNIRGINIGNERPDFLLCDDAQTKENAKNPTLSQELLEWFTGTFFKVVTPFKSVICFVGNMTDVTCVLYKLKEHPDWMSLITGCILENGESLWPELHPIESLINGFFHDEALGEGDTWFAEMMNDPVAKSDALLTGPLPIDRFEYIIEPEAAFVTLDPAGFKDGADDNVLTGHQILNGKYYVAEMDGGKWDPGTCVKNGIKMLMRINGNILGVESVAYQSTFAYWFNEYCKQEHINGIEAIPLPIPHVAKEKRIRAFVKEMYAGEYSFLRDIDRQRFTWQASMYRSGKKKNKDDWLDSPALGLVIRNKFRHLLKLRKDPGVTKPLGVVTNNTSF